ncbi:MAG: hypothetical protein F4X92_04190, partial [Gammaproteobacteria bacterium]|nr:hypothetical protein [Gammaproteobacteria bacterium]
MKQNVPGRFAAFLLLNRVPLVLTVIILFLLLFTATDIEVEKIESIIHDQVSRAASISGAEAVKFEVDGRDLLVYGSVPNITTMNQLTENVSLLQGIRSTKFDVDISPERISYLKIVHVGTDQVRLEGELSQQSEVEDILVMFSRIMPSAQLIRNLNVNPNVSDSFWHDILEPVLEQVADVQNFTLEFGLGQVVLSGLMESQVSYTQVIMNLERLTAENDLKFVNRVGTRLEV